MKRRTLPAAAVLSVAGIAAHAAGAPADRLPTPQPEVCMVFEADPAEGEYAYPEGLGYDAVTKALDGVIQTALYCGQPDGFSELRLTYELLVGCDGVVAEVEVSYDDGAPDDYLACVSSVLKKADFPAHDVEGGMPITYPVNVAW